MADKIKKIYDKKQTAFRKTFGSDNGKDVLADLRTFCFATKPTIGIESDGISKAIEMARKEGRREVFDRIVTFLKLDYDAIYELDEDIYD